MSILNWSKQQDAIFEWFEQNDGSNLVVVARAGCAKTTSIIEGVRRAPDATALLCAFNKKIADELTARLNRPGAQAKTLHAIGFSMVKRYWPSINVGRGTEPELKRADDLTNRVCGQTAPDAIKALVTKLHSLGRETVPHATHGDHLLDLAEAFDCVPEDRWVAEGFTVDYVASKAAMAMDLAAREKPVKTGIDFSDMIFLPIRNGWLRPTFDLVVVDEAQDMTVAQLEIARGVCKGRLCIVGDDRQAIYGFRGADSQSLGRLQQELQAKTLGLTITYRCGQDIVALAAQLVPDFEAGPKNGLGEIRTMPSDAGLPKAVEHGDFVLSRANAPLVGVAMAILKDGKRARIAGRDIGTGLKKLIRSLSGGRAANSVPELLAKISGWRLRQVERAVKAKKSEAQIEAIHDQADTLVSLAEGAISVNDVVARIDALFTDDGLGAAGVVTCSSVHRAKGLEASRVFVLADTLKDHSDEELNIQYVAITRAKQTLVMVGSYKGPMRIDGRA